MEKNSSGGHKALAKTTLLLMAVSLMWATSMAAADKRPRIVDLPDGFQPEGIVTKSANTFFVGSIPTGAIYKGNLKTGSGSVFVPEQDERNAIGLSIGKGMLFVAGGSTGQAYVYDVRDGEEIETFQLATGQSFVNDVVATKEAAFFTDSVNPVLYKVAIEGNGEVGTPEVIPLTGDLVYSTGFNANGIDALPDGSALVVVQSNEGELFWVDPESGATEMIDLGGETVTNGDGLLLHPRRTLWVVRNQDNLLVKIKLESELGSGEIVGEFTKKSFDVPTTVARSGDYMALVNARFGTTDPQPAEYWISQIRRPK